MTAPTDPLSLGDGFDNKGLAPAAASLRHRAGGPADPSLQGQARPKALVTWRILSRLRDFLFEAPTPPGFWRASDGTEPTLRCDRCDERTPITVHGLCLNCRSFNLVCTRIAIVLLAGIAAIYLETLL